MTLSFIFVCASFNVKLITELMGEKYVQSLYRSKMVFNQDHRTG